MARIEAQDDRKAPLFIHSELDDFGLDPYAFRIYARLARRAGGPKGAYESVASMADGCRMSERRVHQALRDLEEHNLIGRSQRAGATSVYHLRPVTAWGGSASGADPTPASGAEGGLHQVQGGSASGADKGTPTKVIQEKGLRTSPTGDKLAKPSGPSMDQIRAVFDAYNEHCGDLPTARVLTSSRESKIRTLIKDLGFDEALAVMGIAAAEVSKDEFWLKPKNRYGLDNLLAGQKLIQKAETAMNRGGVDREAAETNRILGVLRSAAA